MKKLYVIENQQGSGWSFFEFAKSKNDVLARLEKLKRRHANRYIFRISKYLKAGKLKNNDILILAKHNELGKCLIKYGSFFEYDGERPKEEKILAWFKHNEEYKKMKVFYKKLYIFRKDIHVSKEEVKEPEKKHKIMLDLDKAPGSKKKLDKLIGFSKVTEKWMNRIFEKKEKVLRRYEKFRKLIFVYGAEERYREHTQVFDNLKNLNMKGEMKLI